MSPRSRPLAALDPAEQHNAAARREGVRMVRQRAEEYRARARSYGWGQARSAAAEAERMGSAMDRLADTMEAECHG